MRQIVDYKEKIRKLLALAESPVEAEARAALLKARQLMAEHKLTERECRETENQAVKDVLTDITCSKRREPWIIPLSATIGENYCCKGYRKRYHGQQTQHVGFIGLEDDVEICIAVFKYAVDCIRAGVKNIRREYADFYGGPQHDIPYMTYAGYVTEGSPDITEGKLTEAFKKAGTVLRIMKRLAEEAEQRVVE